MTLLVFPLLNMPPASPLVFWLFALPPTALVLLFLYRAHLAKAAGVAKAELFKPQWWLFALALFWAFASMATASFHMFGLPVLIVWVPMTCWRLVRESRAKGAPKVGVLYAGLLLAAVALAESLYWTGFAEAMDNDFIENRYKRTASAVGKVLAGHRSSGVPRTTDEISAAAIGDIRFGARAFPRYYSVHRCQVSELGDACYVARPLRPTTRVAGWVWEDPSSDPFIWWEGGLDGEGDFGTSPYCSLEWPPSAKTPCPDFANPYMPWQHYSFVERFPDFGQEPAEEPADSPTEKETEPQP